MSQADTAKKLNVSESYYFLIEAGERKQDMSLSLMEKIATAFDVPVAYIVDCELKYKKRDGDEQFSS